MNTRATPEPVAPTPSPAPDIAGLVERLSAACVGHPNALIAWPHRILHEAATALQRVAQERDDYAALEREKAVQLDAMTARCWAAEARIATARDEGLEMAEARMGELRHTLAEVTSAGMGGDRLIDLLGECITGDDYIAGALDAIHRHYAAAIRALKGTKP